jgi:hypothetical protein
VKLVKAAAFFPIILGAILWYLPLGLAAVRFPSREGSSWLWIATLLLWIIGGAVCVSCADAFIVKVAPVETLVQ